MDVLAQRKRQQESGEKQEQSSFESLHSTADFNSDVRGKTLVKYTDLKFTDIELQTMELLIENMWQHLAECESNTLISKDQWQLQPNHVFASNNTANITSTRLTLLTRVLVSFKQNAVPDLESLFNAMFYMLNTLLTNAK